MSVINQDNVVESLRAIEEAHRLYLPTEHSHSLIDAITISRRVR